MYCFLESSGAKYFSIVFQICNPKRKEFKRSSENAFFKSWINRIYPKLSGITRKKTPKLEIWLCLDTHIWNQKMPISNMDFYGLLRENLKTRFPALSGLLPGSGIMKIPGGYHQNNWKHQKCMHQNYYDCHWALPSLGERGRSLGCSGRESQGRQRQGVQPMMGSTQQMVKWGTEVINRLGSAM